MSSHLLWQVRRQTDLIAACIERRRRLAFRTRPLICMKTYSTVSVHSFRYVCPSGSTSSTRERSHFCMHRTPVYGAQFDRTRPLICMKTHQSPVDLPSHEKTRRRAVDLREKSLHSCRSARQNGDIDARTMSLLTGYTSACGVL